VAVDQEARNSINLILAEMATRWDGGTWGVPRNFSMMVRQAQPPASGSSQFKGEDLEVDAGDFVHRNLTGGIVARKISELDEETNPVAGDWCLLQKADGTFKKVKVSNMTPTVAEIRTEMDDNSTKFADILTDTTAILAGGAIQFITGPLVAVQDPANPLSKLVRLAMHQNADKIFTIVILDADGDAVDLSGKTFRFVVHTDNQKTVGNFKIDDDGITLSGVANNVVKIRVQPAQSTVALNANRWILWNVTDKAALAYGTFQVEPAVFDLP